jgi:low temperature requirement protein LtrA
VSNQTADRFRRWFWRPPRVHGDVILDRRVSSLELFYDLVYVVVISQATHQLAQGITVRAVLDFAVIFSMIVVA